MEKRETAGHKDQAYREIAAAAYADPFDKKLAGAYFLRHEASNDHDPWDDIKYQQLRYLHDDGETGRLNKLAEMFLGLNKGFLAELCLAESLRRNPGQRQVFDLLRSLQPDQKPELLVRKNGRGCRISVIMTTFNSGRMIKESIASVLDQDFDDFELVIVNDGGSEETDGHVDSFDSPRIRYRRLNQNTGRAAALNEAVLMSRGECIAYLDDDDVFYPGHLKFLSKALSAGREPLVYGKTLKTAGKNVNGAFKQFKRIKTIGEDFNRKLFFTRTLTTTCAALHKRSLFREMGLFRNDLYVSVDWEFWIRCLARHDFRHLDRYVAEYRHHVDNVTKTNAVGAAFMWKIMPNYYAFYEGRIAAARHLLETGQDKEAGRVYEGLKAMYRHRTVHPEVFDEIIALARRCGDNGFLRMLAKDYFSIEERAFLSTLKKTRSLPMALGIARHLPYCVLRRLVSRARNWTTITKPLKIT